MNHTFAKGHDTSIHLVEVRNFSGYLLTLSKETVNGNKTWHKHESGQEKDFAFNVQNNNEQKAITVSLFSDKTFIRNKTGVVNYLDKCGNGKKLWTYGIRVKFGDRLRLHKQNRAIHEGS